ncbi:hypothetical protein A5780_14500 [Nocardia sp. 852002-20019_SCH5090214]|uniref:hypothetical protein n=1 Tax=Nocardia sp. 852002-20019_SCH5090214 TaxID=1834087 RepID=UPI0007EA5A87|nr:hypothetical protein [Nocardia sp. 852002-20019_SCH5090214]OBA66268.1 hypothetical protein A5780_14500 [Nocardia sp. 852002-20019_SCH5090214]
MLTAWGDESGSQPERDPGTYLLAAALVEADDVEVVRKTMDGLRLPGEKKVHWQQSSDERRELLVRTVAELPSVSVVVVHHEQDANDRRHRRKCLEYLLPQLAEMPCSHITFESRKDLDRSDQDILGKFRARKVIGAGLRIHHSVGRTEPVLWVADVVCGAVVQQRVGNPHYLDQLGGLIDIRHI